MGFFTSAADEQQKLEQILNQFPGPVTLYESRWKWIWFAVFFLILSFISYSLVTGDETNLIRRWFGRRNEMDLIVGFPALLVFGPLSACAIYAVIFPQTNRLTLRHNNFEAVDLFKRNNCGAEWKHASNFTTMKSHKWVAFYDDSGAFTAPPSSLSAGLQTIRCNRLLSRTYGFTVEALAELMTRWREKAIQQP